MSDSQFSLMEIIASEISSQLDPEILYQKVIEIALEHIGACNSSLFLSNSQDELVLKIAGGQYDHEHPQKNFQKARKFRIGEGICGWVAQHNEAALIQDAANDSRFAHLQTEVGKITSLLCLPIRSNQQCVGVLNLSHPEIAQFSQRNQQILTFFTNQIGVAVANANLYRQLEQSLTDLKKAHNFNQNIIDNSDNCLLVLHKDFSVALLNRRATALLQISPTEIVGKKLTDLSLMPTISAVFRDYASDEITLKEKLDNGTFAISAENDADISVRVAFQYVLNEQNQIDGYLLKLRELSDEQERESKICQQLQTQYLNETLIGFAHQFRNPLTQMQAVFAQCQQSLSPEKARSFQTYFQQLQKLLDEFLRFISAETTERELIDMQDFVESCLFLVQLEAQAKQLDIQTRWPSSRLLVNVEKPFLEQAFFNLVTNAIEHAPTQTCIRISVSSQNQKACIQVHNEGEHIPPENRTRIFHPFFSTHENHMGMGLALARKWLQRQQGDVLLLETDDSKNGSTFEMQLPLIRENE